MARENSTISVQVTDGNLVFTVKDAGTVTFRPAMASATCNAQATLHGWKQRLSDAAALSRDTKSGQAASPADKLAAIKDLAEYYMTGTEEWRRASAGGGGVGAERIRLINALDRFRPEAAGQKHRDYVGKLDTKQVRAMLADARLKEVLAAMDAEASAGVDTEALFGEL